VGLEKGQFFFRDHPMPSSEYRSNTESLSPESVSQAGLGPTNQPKS
jgi:hypothetical protein